jgi:hypothetical protein
MTQREHFTEGIRVGDTARSSSTFGLTWFGVKPYIESPASLEILVGLSATAYSSADLEQAFSEWAEESAEWAEHTFQASAQLWLKD